MSSAMHSTRGRVRVPAALLLAALVCGSAETRTLFRSGFEEESQLLLRTGFEDPHPTIAGPEGWLPWDEWEDPTGFYEWDDQIAARGERSLKLFEATGRFAYRSDPVPIPEKGALRLRGVIRTSGVYHPRGAVLAIELLDAKGKRLRMFESGPALEDSDWLPYTALCLVEPGATQAAAMCLINGDGTAWFDELELVWMPDVALDAPPFWQPIQVFADDTGQWAWVDDDVRSGEKAVRLWGATRSFGLAGTASEIGERDTLRLSGWVKTEWMQGSNGATMAMQFFDSEHRPMGLAQSEPVMGTSRWQRVTLEQPPPQGAAWVAPICLVNGPGVAWFDDIRLSAFESDPVMLIDAAMPTTARPGDVIGIQLRLQTARKLESDDPLIIELTPVSGEGTPIRAEFEASPPPTMWPVDKEVGLAPVALELGEYVALGLYRLRLQLGADNIDSGDARLPRISITKGRTDLPEGAAVRMTLAAPATVAAGSVLSAQVECQFAGPFGSEAAGYLGLFDRDGRVLLDEVPVDLRPSADGVRGLLSARAVLGIPPSFPAGEYLLRCGLIGPFSVGGAMERKVTVTGSGNTEGREPWPMAHGTFVDRHSSAHRWFVDRDGVLNWDLRPYVPVGGVLASAFLATFIESEDRVTLARFTALEERLDLLKQMGVHDVYLAPGCNIVERPTYVVQRILDALDERGMRYGLKLGGPADEGSTAYRVDGGFTYPDARSGQVCSLAIDAPAVRGGHAIVIAFDNATGALYGAQLAPLQHPIGIDAPSATVSFIIGTQEENRSFRAYVVPQCVVPAGRGVGDVWSNFDRRRARLVDYVSRLSFGPGFRFFLSPLCDDLQLRPLGAIPDESTGMPLAFATWLQAQYGDPEALARAWAVTPTPASFDLAARLIPSAKQDTSVYAVDPVTLSVHVMDRSASRFEVDLDLFREQSVAECIAILADDLKAIADVPVVVERDWETRAFFTAIYPGGGPDGVAFRASAPTALLPETGAMMAAAEASLGRHTLWRIASQVSRPIETGGEGVGFLSPENLVETMEELSRSGARGLYALGASLDGIGGLAAYDLARAPDQLQALAHLNGVMAQRVPALGRPELIYVYPAARGIWADEGDTAAFGLDGSRTGRKAFRGPTGAWVVPAPAVGGEGGDFIIAVEGLGRSPGALDEAKAILSTLGRRCVLIGTVASGVRIDVLDKYYDSAAGQLPDGAVVQKLRPPPEAEILGRAADGTVWHIRVGDIEIMARWPMTLDEVLARSTLLGAGDLSVEPAGPKRSTLAPAAPTTPRF